MAIGQDLEVLDRLIAEGREILGTLKPSGPPADKVRYGRWVRDCLDFTREISREHHEQIEDLQGDEDLAFFRCQMILGILDLVRSLLTERVTRPSSKTLKQICYYRWEFLRRNPEYRKDYKEFLEFCNKKNWDPKSGSVRYETFEKNHDRQKRLKYGIAFLENPDKHIPLEKFEENPFWPLIEDRGFKGPTWPSILKPHYPKGEPVIRIYTDQFKEKIVAPLALIIDLTSPKREIIARVKKLVDDAIEERKRLGLDIHRGRKRFDLYDRYLKIWDLRQKGLTYKQMAAKVYPGEPLDYELEPDYDDREYDDKEYDKRVDDLIAQGEPQWKAHEIAEKEFGLTWRKNPTIQRIIVQYREAKRLVEDGYKGIF